MTASIIEHFASLKDPRIERKKLHKLMDIIVLVISATVSGAEGWEAIEQFGHDKEEWLKQFIALENGIPSHDCISYVMSRLSVKGFQECFMSWSQASVSQCEGEIINVDGKTARGSRDKKNNRNPLHMVSAWASKNRLVLGQEAVDEKSNEITAVPKLLALLELKGCIVTTDAMSCQRQTAEQIIEQEGDYCLALKENQPLLYEATVDFFEVAQAKQWANVEHDFFEEIDKGHGRLEIRRYWISGHLASLPNTEKWKGLRTIGMAERICITGDKETREYRYFINSIAADAKLFAEAVRGHWGVENLLHWRLDVVFREDASRIRKGNAPAVMTMNRHLCMGLLDGETSFKGSLPKKRFKAALNDDYRAKVVFGLDF